MGECDLAMTNPRNGKKYQVHFVVVEEDLTPLTGYMAAVSMEFATINEDKFVRVNVAGADLPFTSERLKEALR